MRKSGWRAAGNLSGTTNSGSAVRRENVGDAQISNHAPYLARPCRAARRQLSRITIRRGIGSVKLLAAPPWSTSTPSVVRVLTLRR